MKAVWTAALLFGATATAAPAASSSNASCHCLPGDACWPSAAKWNALNSTVGGRLIATVPIGSVCHEPTYDAEACAQLQEDWNLPQTQYGFPISLDQVVEKG